MTYDRAALLYDALAHVYSWGAIARAKRQHATRVFPGREIAYVGGGSCEEGVVAARNGARVTVIDTSPRMLDKARDRFRCAGLEASFHRADALAHQKSYDQVVAPFFFNVFAGHEVAPAMIRVAHLLRSGGQLTVVDFRAPSDFGPFRLLQKLYYLPPLTLFHLWTRTPWHPLYDYPALFSQSGLRGTMVERSVERMLGVPLFETITWRLS